MLVHGIKRRTVMAVPRLASVPALVAQTDLVALLPRAFSMFLAQNYDLAIHETPFRFPQQHIYMMWHTKLDSDPRPSMAARDHADCRARAYRPAAGAARERHAVRGVPQVAAGKPVVQAAPYAHDLHDDQRVAQRVLSALPRSRRRTGSSRRPPAGQARGR